MEPMKAEGYRMEKPMLVRPFDGVYQIIGGHTRHQAAQMAGLEKVLCVVEEMDDDTAILRIAQDNLNDPFSCFSQCIYVAQNSVKDSKKGLSRSDLIRACTGKEGAERVCEKHWQSRRNPPPISRCSKYCQTDKLRGCPRSFRQGQPPIRHPQSPPFHWET